MIKLELVIKEENKINFKNKVATCVNVELIEKGINATKEEKDACKLLKGRLNIKGELVIDKTNGKDYEEIIKLLNKVKDLMK